MLQAELYKRLLAMEELLERASTKQAWKIEDALRDRPSLLRTLRICVCNTHKNQPALRSTGAEEKTTSGGSSEVLCQTDADGSQDNAFGPAEWTLHILGDVFGVEKDSQRLTDFIEKVSFFWLARFACVRRSVAL